MVDAIPGVNNAQTNLTQLAGGIVVRPTEKQEEAKGTRIAENEEKNASKFEKSEEDLRLQAIVYSLRNQFKQMLQNEVVSYTIYTHRTGSFLIRLTHLEEGTIRVLSESDIMQYMAENNHHFIDADS